MKTSSTQKKILLIFANSAIKKGTADAKELQGVLQAEADARGKNEKIYITFGRSLSYFVSNNRSVVYDHLNRMLLEDYDFVYFRKAGAMMQQMLSCAVYLRQHGVPFYDKEIYLANSRNKLSQMFKLQRAGVPIPTTFFCRHKTRMLRLVTTKYKEYFQFPIIAKATGGTRGAENYLVQTPEELLQIVRGSRRQFLIQSFVPNDGDLRVLVINGKVRAVIARVAASGSHLNNTSQGGTAEWQPANAISRGVQHDAEQAAIILRRDCAGVDVIFDKHTGAHYILEVNRAPQIEHSSYPQKKAGVLLDAIEESMAEHMPPAATMLSKGEARRVVGRFETIAIPGVVEGVIAKVDTGADTSSIHCERIKEVAQEGKQLLRYSFEPTGGAWHETAAYSRRAVRSSNGQVAQRYAVVVPIQIGGHKFQAAVTLSRRDDMGYAMLLGRRFLRDNRLVVDVSRRFVLTRNIQEKP